MSQLEISPIWQSALEYSRRSEEATRLQKEARRLQPTDGVSIIRLSSRDNHLCMMKALKTIGEESARLHVEKELDARLTKPCTADQMTLLIQSTNEDLIIMSKDFSNQWNDIRKTDMVDMASRYEAPHAGVFRAIFYGADLTALPSSLKYDFSARSLITDLHSRKILSWLPILAACRLNKLELPRQKTGWKLWFPTRIEKLILQTEDAILKLLLVIHCEKLLGKAVKEDLKILESFKRPWNLSGSMQDRAKRPLLQAGALPGDLVKVLPSGEEGMVDDTGCFMGKTGVELVPSHPEGQPTRIFRAECVVYFQRCKGDVVVTTVFTDMVNETHVNLVGEDAATTVDRISPCTPDPLDYKENLSVEQAKAFHKLEIDRRRLKQEHAAYFRAAESSELAKGKKNKSLSTLISSMTTIPAGDYIHTVAVINDVAPGQVLFFNTSFLIDTPIENIQKRDIKKLRYRSKRSKYYRAPRGTGWLSASFPSDSFVSQIRDDLFNKIDHLHPKANMSFMLTDSTAVLESEEGSTRLGDVVSPSRGMRLAHPLLQYNILGTCLVDTPLLQIISDGIPKTAGVVRIRPTYDNHLSNLAEKLFSELSNKNYTECDTQLDIIIKAYPGIKGIHLWDPTVELIKFSPLIHEAVKYEWISGISRLLELPHSGLESVRDYKYRNPLHIVAMTGNCDIALLLLPHYECINVPDSSGKTPLSIALGTGLVKQSDCLVLLLIEKMKLFNEFCPKGFVNKEATPLQILMEMLVIESDLNLCSLGLAMRLARLENSTNDPIELPSLLIEKITKKTDHSLASEVLLLLRHGAVNSAIQYIEAIEASSRKMAIRELISVAPLLCNEKDLSVLLSIPVVKVQLYFDNSHVSLRGYEKYHPADSSFPPNPIHRIVRELCTPTKSTAVFDTEMFIVSNDQLLTNLKLIHRFSKEGKLRPESFHVGLHNNRQYVLCFFFFVVVWCLTLLSSSQT